MPYCEREGCGKRAAASELRREVNTGLLLCLEHQEGTTVIGLDDDEEELDYEISYTRRRGLHASVSYGGAKISLNVDQKEISRILGI